MIETTHVLDGVEIATLEAGEGGVPLLAVHGFTGCKEDFADELDPLAQLGFHVVAPDLRGHGQSTHLDDESAYSFVRFAEDLWRLADDLEWDRFDLLGHSMGGMVAQLMVLERPERIGRLVLMDTHHGVVPGLDPDLIQLGVELARTEGLEVIQQLLAAGADPLDNPAYHRVCLERPGYEEWAESKMLRASAVMYAAMLEQLSGATDRLDLLAAVTSPTLVVVGELDHAFVDAAHAIANRIPLAVLDVIADAGHSPQFEATDAWRSSVHGFLVRPIA
jgi:pimeloyl-ACP methyl ester carboxylesterase